MFHKKIRQPLKNTLKDLKGCNIKIGSNTSFFYCGKVDKNIETTLTKISEKYQKWYENALAKAREKYNSLDSTYDMKIAKANEKYKRSKKKRKVAIDKLLKQKEKDKDLLPKKIGSLFHYLRNWKPFLERDVLYVVDSIDMEEKPNTYVIKITGLENGKYWFTKEYEKDQKKKREKTNPKTLSRQKLYHEIYLMATSGKYTIQDVIDKYKISRPTYKKIIEGERKKIKDKYEKLIAKANS